MQITIHRGSCEIGGSCVELRSGASRLIIDLGMPLYKRDGSRFNMVEVSELPETELVASGVLPDIPGFYFWDKAFSAVDGILISHSHADHYGFLPFVHSQVPVYAGEATHRLLELNTVFTPFSGINGEKIIFTDRVSFSCGEFKITPFLVDHSAFDAYAFLIEAGGKRLFYSGDFRDHGRKPYALKNIIRELYKTRVDALLLEGTMFARQQENVQRESDIEDKIVNVLKEKKVPAFLCVSAQNIDRLVSFYRAAIRCRRTLVVDVYTANVLEELKKFARIPFPSNNYEFLKVFFPFSLCRRIIREGYGERIYRFKRFKITRKEIEDRQKEIMMMVRPSMLGDLKKLQILPRAKLLYSMWKGHTEEADMSRLIKFAKQRQMEISSIHTTGHATIETLKKLIEAIKPHTVIPIHTFHPEKYSKLAANIRILRDKEKASL